MRAIIDRKDFRNWMITVRPLSLLVCASVVILGVVVAGLKTPRVGRLPAAVCEMYMYVENKVLAGVMRSNSARFRNQRNLRRVEEWGGGGLRSSNSNLYTSTAAQLMHEIMTTMIWYMQRYSEKD